jgi:MFS family permease
MATQFASALADNALLIVAIALLDSLTAPQWMTPFLKFFFIASFVIFAFVVGAFADTFPKPRVMLVANTIKGVGCGLMMLGVQPLLAYAMVGFGAATYSPAKYGLLTELMPPRRLVRANAWLEALTIASVILGALLGGVLVSPEFAAIVGMTARSTAALRAALVGVLILYAVAAALNLLIPDSGVRYVSALQKGGTLFRTFRQALRALLDDPAGRASLLVTTLLWGVGATLQFVVIDWSRERLMLSLDRAAMLPGVVAIGVAAGAVCAARWVTIERALSILPVGLLLGPLVIAVLPLHSVTLVALLLFANGVAAGFFIVPMNALLQHRGAELVHAGQAIAVQNFFENLSVMIMLALYALLRGTHVPLAFIVVALGAFTSTAMAAIRAYSGGTRSVKTAATIADPR